MPVNGLRIIIKIWLRSARLGLLVFIRITEIITQNIIPNKVIFVL